MFGGWLLVIDFRFLKKADHLDAPGLLNLFEKRSRYNFISWLVFYFIFIIGGIFVVSGLDIGAYVGVAIWLVIVAILFYSTGGPWWYRKEKNIIEQLRELVEKK